MRNTYFSLSFLVLSFLLMPAVVYPQIDDLKWSRGPGGLYPVTKWDATAGVNRIGFIDNTGKLVIDYDRLPSSAWHVGEFHEGRAAIFLRKKNVPPGEPANDIGFIDERGNMVIPPRYFDARPFSEGLAYVQSYEFRGFIDLQGRPVVNTGIDRTRDFHEGLAAVTSSERGRSGYIDRTGKMVIQGQYSFLDDFSEGLAGVLVDREFGFINKKGEMVISPRFVPRRGWYAWDPIIATSRFSEGLAPVSIGSEFSRVYGYINHKGEFVIPPQFYAAQLFSEGLAFVAKLDPVTNDVAKAGWIDKTGQWVVTDVEGRFPPNTAKADFSPYHHVDWRYSEGLVQFRIHSSEGRTLHGYMDQKGKVVIEPRAFNQADPFVGGLARVFVTGQEGSSDDYGYINKTGKFIWRYTK
jgi:hypothetical protein